MTHLDAARSTDPAAHASSTTLPRPPGARVRMFGKPACAFCIRARLLLWWRGVDFAWIDVSGRDDLRAELLRVTGRKTVPQIFFGDEPIGGYDDLAALDRAGELEARLSRIAT